ncbi:MAG: ABC transporter ATP-binding protein [Neisseriaceae bacterium]|nr:ABC transporter ATP-binding protein [Neisseriaceae bacterium]
MLNLNNVTIQFGGLVAVNNVSMSVARDEVVGLVGPNGAGKTTLFNAVSGLVKPSSGEIQFQAQNMLKTALHQRARMGIGRSFQIPQPMHELSVRENLIVAQRFGTGRVDHDKIDDILQFMGLMDKAHSAAATALALTELKALEVAKALATEPQLLLLDEVLAGLETTGKRHFMQLLHTLHKERQIGILIIEHDIDTISQMCSRVCVLNFGELIANGTPEEVFSHPEVIKSYTGESHA